MSWFSSLFIKPPEGTISADSEAKLPDIKEALKKLVSEDFASGDRLVYIFIDKNGSVFYVGIDVEGKNYSSNQSPYVKEYVENTLNGEYSIEVLKQNISSGAASHLKDRVLELYSNELINTQNFHRKVDMGVFDKYRAALDEYDNLLIAGISYEKTDLHKAIDLYESAYNSYIEAMNSRDFDATEAYLKAHTPPPPSKLVDRLSLCLKKTKEHQRLIDFSERYFLYFTRSDRTTGEMNLLKRFLEARNQLNQHS